MTTNTRYPYWPDYTDEEGDVVSAYFAAICEDCVEGRCHWGSDAYRAAHPEARDENCNCTRRRTGTTSGRSPGRSACPAGLAR